MACPEMLINEKSRSCPFCSDGHQMRLHGWYKRHAITPSPMAPHRIPVRRLYCTRTGRTLSLLPDFCLPRRQHGPAILALFLESFLLFRQTLLDSIHRARDEDTSHAVAQSLRDGFARRESLLRSYIESTEPAGRTYTLRQRLTKILEMLFSGFSRPDFALLHHGRCFHARFGVGLA